MIEKILITLLTFVMLVANASNDRHVNADKATQKALAEQYVQALQDKDLGAINQLIDYDAFAERVLSQLPEKNKLTKRLKDVFIRGQKDYQIKYSNRAYITLIGWRELVGFSGYVVRMVDESYSASYLGLVVKKINSQWRVVDFYDATVQDMISHNVATNTKQMALNSDSLVEQLKTRYKASDRKKLMLFLMQVKYKKFSEAVITYRDFSDKLKKEEVVIAIGLGISHYYNDDEQFYDELIEVIGQHYQNNPKYYGKLIDYFFMKKKYDKAREVSRVFFDSVSDNAMKNIILAFISSEEENYSQALKEIKLCVKSESDFSPCYDVWVTIADQIKNYDEEVAAYTTVSEKMDIKYTKSMFNEKEDYEFIQSDAFKNWDIPEK